MSELNCSEETLFAALSQLTAPERQARLQEVCGQDAALRQRLELLLAAHDRARQFMAEPVAPVASRDTAFAIPLAERLGDRIGPYKVLQRIGEGGCGVVYMAQQDKPVRRLVALKVIKLGMDTRAVVARFEAERQALALMDHPNIAKVLDAGATETGRPFFVMELVRGIKITDYSDQNQLTTAQRLELFIQVCRAVQHAHQKGIIHRDLKPSNILVAINDGVPVPKVIDFGIAKATQGRLTDMTLVTAFDQFIGTPAYVSPEQAVMTILDVDTRSDIYSLGVLLYELLTGKTPFDTQQLLATGLDELRRTIREEQPMRPSTRLTALDQAAQTTVAKARRTEPARLASLLRGDLDWIVMKCLEKDRARRYDTANGLAHDIERHLRYEPVTARPPNRLYEFQRTVRRHWVGFAAVAAVLTALCVGVVVSTLEAARARRAEQQATKIGASEAKARSLAEQALYEARLGEARAKRLSGMAGQRFESLVAISEAGRIHRSREVSDEAIASLALTDLRVKKTVSSPDRKTAQSLLFDDRLELYAYSTEKGIVIRRAADGQETAFLSVRDLSGRSYIPDCLQFEPRSSYLCARLRLLTGETHWRIWDLRREGSLALDLIANFVTFSPNGQNVALARADGTIWLQAIDPSCEPKRFNIGAYLSQVCFSPDGTKIAGFENRSTRLGIWDSGSGKPLGSCLNSEEIVAVAWSQDGALVALGGPTGGITLWDIPRGQLRLRLERHRDRVVKLAFDPEGALLASSSWDGTTRLWDVKSGQQLVVYPGGSPYLRFSPDGRTLACAAEGSECHLLEVARPAGYRRLRRSSGLADSQATESFSAFDFSQDWRLVAIAGQDGIRMLDTLAGQEIGTVTRYRSFWVHFSEGAVPSLWSTTVSGVARWPLRFDLETETPTIEIRGAQRRLVEHPASSFALDREERRMALITPQIEGRPLDNDEGVLLVDLLHESTPPIFCPHARAGCVAVEPAGRWLVTGTWKGTGVRVWDFSTGRLIRDLPLAGSANVAVCPDGSWLATADTTECRLWETSSWSPMPHALPCKSILEVGQLAFSPDGRLLAIYHDPAEIQIVQVPTLEPVTRLMSLVGMNITALRFSPDGNRLAALEKTGDLHIWDLRAIRAQLKQLDLDWELPPLLAPADPLSARPPAFVLRASRFSGEELARMIPCRATNAPEELIDLTKYYNAPLVASWHTGAEERNDLSELPQGLQTLAGTQFDVRGLIQIGASEVNGMPYPTRIESISIDRLCRRLHFLHASVFSNAHLDDRLGTYRIQYMDGRQLEVPILFGRDLADWWSSPGEEGMNYVVAWTGENPEARRNGAKVRLFRTTWENPYPTARIRQFDFISENSSRGAPFLVALTAEP